MRFFERSHGYAYCRFQTVGIGSQVFVIVYEKQISECIKSGKAPYIASRKNDQQKGERTYELYLCADVV